MIIRYVIGFLLAFCSVSGQTIVDSIQINGVWRNYRVYLPTNFNSSLSLPLVFNMHGYGSNAFEQELYSQFDSVAEDETFIVCYPNGINNAWSVIDNTDEDVNFIDTLITVLNSEYNINTNRVYATGMSNGGFMSNLLACRLANKIAAIAPVAGTNFITVQDSCFPSRKVPVLQIHGDADAVVLYSGTPAYASVEACMQLFAGVNGCGTTDTVPVPDISGSDLSTAEIITWNNCDSNRQVVHYRIINGGHTWPGSPVIIGVTNQDFVGSKIIWEFFDQFSLNTSVPEKADKNIVDIFPNPFQSYFTVRMASHKSCDLEIFSHDGRLIKSQSGLKNNGRVYLNDIPSGIYYVRAKSGNNVNVIKLLRE